MEVDKILEKIKNLSLRPIENEQAFKKYLTESLENGKLITFYDFECPLREVKKDLQGNEYINYLVDMKKVFSGQRLDMFTELPKVVENKKREIRILNLLKDLGLNFRFVKIIADTNLKHITPESLNYIDSQKVSETFLEFKNKIVQKVKDYPVAVEVVFFTELISELNQKYLIFLNQANRKLEINRLVGKKIIDLENERIREHVGIVSNSFCSEFSLRTIATYAAEGVIFEFLTKTEAMSNAVWFNLYEIDERTIVITNALRKIKNLGSLPMVFMR